MRRLLLLPLLALPLFVLSCETDQTPNEPEVMTPAVPSFDVAPPEAASGNVTFVIEGDELGSFTFHATNTPAGPVGAAVLQGGTTRITSKVRCITVVGNEAWVEADIVATNNYFPVAQGWRVLDGGSGPPDDKMSPVYGFLTEGEFCDGLPDLELRDLVSGDIRVR